VGFIPVQDPLTKLSPGKVNKDDENQGVVSPIGAPTTARDELKTSRKSSTLNHAPFRSRRFCDPLGRLQVICPILCLPVAFLNQIRQSLYSGRFISTHKSSKVVDCMEALIARNFKCQPNELEVENSDDLEKV
jgi:hypothetical protein